MSCALCLAGTHLRADQTGCDDCGADNLWSENEADMCEVCPVVSFTSGNDADITKRTACSTCPSRPRECGNDRTESSSPPILVHASPIYIYGPNVYARAAARLLLSRQQRWLLLLLL